MRATGYGSLLASTRRNMNKRIETGMETLGITLVMIEGTPSMEGAGQNKPANWNVMNAAEQARWLSAECTRLSGADHFQCEAERDVRAGHCNALSGAEQFRCTEARESATSGQTKPANWNTLS